ncbi:DNA glycosylase [Calorimonas adulescens]|uniref:DNA-(apurinic or apyrimidinic site) lyase n=1 Tax=Calorimonas adulescens TaxID=2606906 RepID=A0A5D8QIS1_9THEO|nr:DNA glycosylase [Calorimonas adulescens]TZE83178.1 DNA-3-methyladenine glycosylase 2 family protein [Calorimonas adulescens]
MNYIRTDNGILIKYIDNFEPYQVFESGQCFRWECKDDGFVGVVKNKVIKVKKLNGDILIDNVTEEDMDDIIYYFDLERDYNEIKRRLQFDGYMKEAMEYGYGLRILNQEPFECLISYIVSSNNRIPQIKRIIENLSRMYGKPIEYNGDTYYTFPSPDVLADAEVCEIQESRCGFRAEYICDAAKRVAWGDLDLSVLKKMDYFAAKSELMKVKGIGEKVADCILLYSLQKYEAFPVDVWVNRVMTEIYIHQKISFKKIGEYARERFKELAGFAQLYLFYYYRNRKGGGI